MTTASTGWPRSTASRVRWALDELGVGYEFVRSIPRRARTWRPRIGDHPGRGRSRPRRQRRVVLRVRGDDVHLGDTYGRERGLWPAPGRGARGGALLDRVGGDGPAHLPDAVAVSRPRHRGFVRARGPKQGNGRLQPRRIPADARRAGGAARRARLHPGRVVLARRHLGRRPSCSSGSSWAAPSRAARTSPRGWSVAAPGPSRPGRRHRLTSRSGGPHDYRRAFDHLQHRHGRRFRPSCATSSG